MSKETEVAIRAAKEGGAVLLSYFGSPLTANQKNPRDIVTEADHASEREIISVIKEEFPTHSILAEESGHGKADEDALWVIDPLDGTSNFFKGQRDFSVLVSFIRNGTREVGVTYFPLADELFVAERDQGATKNGKPIHVSKEQELQNMYAVTQMSSKLEARTPNLALYSKLLYKVRNIHVFNACISRGLCDVAEGTADFQFRYGFNYWDYAAGVLLVEEAGGKATDLLGNLITENSEHTLISNGATHDALLSLIDPQ